MLLYSNNNSKVYILILPIKSKKMLTKLEQMPRGEPRVLSVDPGMISFESPNFKEDYSVVAMFKQDNSTDEDLMDWAGYMGGTHVAVQDGGVTVYAPKEEKRKPKTINVLNESSLGNSKDNGQEKPYNPPVMTFVSQDTGPGGRICVGR
tara:strand:- start:5960 stop:6406 length:447 start_codon:yes stop_codon:yes gene_type:complete